MKTGTKWAILLAGASAIAVIATPASAATQIKSDDHLTYGLDTNPQFDAPWMRYAEQGAEESAEYRRRFRRRRFRRHRRRGIDGGDILAGILIIGGIAAIADAVDNDNDKKRTYPRRQRQNPRNSRSSDINSAADQCSFAAEERYGNGARVEQISRIERADNGFRVEGTIQVQNELDSFSCGVIGGDIQYLEFGRGAELFEQQ